MILEVRKTLLNAIPNSGSFYLPDADNLGINNKEIDSEYFNSFGKPYLQQTMVYLRQKRDPNSRNGNPGYLYFFVVGEVKYHSTESS